MRISCAGVLLAPAVAPCFFHDLAVHASAGETRAGANPVKQQPTTSRIINGNVAQEGRYPYAVSLVSSGGGHFCGGKCFGGESTVLVDTPVSHNPISCIQRTILVILNLSDLL